MKHVTSIIESPSLTGILPVNKSLNTTSFRLVEILRKKTGIRKIGHAGTLDPMATGVMILLIGKLYTQKSDHFLSADKQYLATLHLGKETDTYDAAGTIVNSSDLIPQEDALLEALSTFQGECLQIPPMFSAKKVQGKKLYDLARKGKIIEREPVSVRLSTSLIRYSYPHIELLIDCSKGTYIRSLAYDLGKLLGCGAHLSSLVRTKAAPFTLSDCISQEELQNPTHDITPYLRKSL